MWRTRYRLRHGFSDPDDRELLDLLPILESLSKVSDVRTIIRRIIEKMTETYGISDKIKDTCYQEDENIKIEDRNKYIQVIGNYHPEIEEYNPAR